MEVHVGAEVEERVETDGPFQTWSSRFKGVPEEAGTVAAPAPTMPSVSTARSDDGSSVIQEDEDATEKVSEEQEAMLRLTRAVKRKKALALLPDLEQLRKLFLNEEAISAGAGGGKFYTSAALFARDAIRRDPEVELALQFAFERCTACTATGTIGREDYMKMMRKIYLVRKHSRQHLHTHPPIGRWGLLAHRCRGTGGEGCGMRV